jgi:hypothetical protein
MHNISLTEYKRLESLTIPREEMYEVENSYVNRLFQFILLCYLILIYECIIYSKVDKKNRLKFLFQK